MELALDLNKRYTYADYMTWLDDVRRELIEGFIKLLPAPADIHTHVSVNLSYQLNLCIDSNDCGCHLRYAPYDVRFPVDGTDDSKIYTVVQPDLCVICNSSKIDKRGCIGAPDLIVEILSPSNRKHDLIVKYDLYQKHGVREYWIVSPKSKTVTVHILQEDGNYDDGTEYIHGEVIPVFIFNGYTIDTARIFKGC